jgi:hypothetical protein
MGGCDKKGPPKSVTARFRVGSLIKLLYYCDFSISNSTLRCTKPIEIKATINLMHTQP